MLDFTIIYNHNVRCKKRWKKEEKVYYEKTMEKSGRTVFVGMPAF